MLPALALKHALAFCLACGFTADAVPAFADPPTWAGVWQVRERYHRPNDVDAEDYRVVYITQPRVADAHLTDPDTPLASVIPVARGLPFGFNRGTCDRALVAPTAIAGTMAGMAGTDRDCVIGALDHLPDNRQIAWAGVDGEIFRVMPERSYPVAGHLCRDFTASIAIGGQKQQTIGTACRQPDGTWEIID